MTVGALTFKDGKIKSTVFTRPHAMKRHKFTTPMLRNWDLSFWTPVNFEVEYFINEETEGVLTDTVIYFSDQHLTWLSDCCRGWRLRCPAAGERVLAPACRRWGASVAASGGVPVLWRQGVRAMGTRGGCRRVQGPPEFSAWGFAPSWHLVCARCGPSSLPPGVGTVAAHAAPYPATSSCCFWRSGPRIASRYSWRTTTLRGSVAVPQLDSMVGGKPRGRIFIWPNMDSDHGNRTSASAVPLPPTPPASAAPPASAGPPASANPQPPNLQEDCRRGPPFRPRVLVISGETRRLSSLSPFQRREGCDRMGRVVRCDKLRDGGLEVEFVSEVDAGRALLATSFTYTAKDKGERHEVNIPISVTAHRTKNGSKGIIFCPDLEDVGDEDIEDGLEEFGVIAARRIKAKRKGVLAPTHNIILTFNQLDLPKEVVVGYLKVKVRPYVPSPLRCFRCLRFGHTREYCKNRPTCGRCAATDHDSSDCRAETLRCINCDATQTPHDAFDRSCPELLREREIMALKVSERLTFREARDRYNATHPKRSYARVAGTAAPTQPAQQPLEQNNITQLIALLRSFGLQVVSAPSVNAGQLRHRRLHRAQLSPRRHLRWGLIRPEDRIVIAAGPWSSVPRGRNERNPRRSRPLFRLDPQARRSGRRSAATRRGRCTPDRRVAQRRPDTLRDPFLHWPRQVTLDR